MQTKTRAYLFSVLQFILVVQFFVGCSDEPKPAIKARPPRFQMDEPTYVTHQEVTLTGKIVDLGSVPIDDHGFIYALSEITSDNEGTKVSLGILDKPETMSLFVDNLIRETKYFARAYVSVNDSTFFGAQITFTTYGTNEWIKVSNGFIGDSDYFSSMFLGKKNFPGLNGKGYLIGQFGSRDGQSVTPLYEYDPPQSSLTRLPDLPGESRDHTARFAAGNKIYIGMGSHSLGYATEFHSFNPETKEWTRVSDFGGIPMALAVSVAFGDRAYVGFGSGEVGTEKTFWEYNATSDVWTKKSSPILSYALRRVLMAVSINNKAYFLFDDTFKLQVWEYEPSSDAWTRKADFTGKVEGRDTPNPNPFLSLSVLGKGYFSDEDGNIWEYNPTTDQWKEIPAPPNKSTFQFGIPINNRIYLGSNQDVYVYIPE